MVSQAALLPPRHKRPQRVWVRYMGGRYTDVVSYDNIEAVHTFPVGGRGLAWFTAGMDGSLIICLELTHHVVYAERTLWIKKRP